MGVFFITWEEQISVAPVIGSSDNLQGREVWQDKLKNKSGKSYKNVVNRSDFIDLEIINFKDTRKLAKIAKVVNGTSCNE